MGVQSAHQPLPRADRRLAQHPRALLARPAGEDRIEQRLLEVQRPDPLPEHSGQLMVHVEAA